MREDSWDKPKNDGCRRREFRVFSQSGRSMIEMLGVLAIIGVLSVGGIAGYSKAMEKFKVNKTISEYNTLMFGFFQHIDDIRKIQDSDASPYQFSDLLVSLELVPPSWGREGKWLADSLGNSFRIYPEYIEIILNYNGRTANKKQISFCRELFNTLAKGYQNELYSAFIWRDYANTEVVHYGNKFCGNTRSCIRNMTFEDINKQCLLCQNGFCSLVLSFKK